MRGLYGWIVAGVVALGCGLSGNAARGSQVAYWNFEDNVLDQQGANHGVLQMGATFASSMPGLGRALSLDGADDYVSTTDLDLNLVSIAAWVNVNAGATNQAYVVNKNFDGSTVPYSLNVGGNNAPNELNGLGYFNGAWRNTQTGANAADFVDLRGGGWRHVAATYDGATLSYYVDGVLRQSSNEGSGNLPQNNNVLDIGRYANDNDYFGGLIDELRVYDHALSAAEVAALVPEPSAAGVCAAAVGFAFLRRRRPAR
jgi:hypothetical protein